MRISSPAFAHNEEIPQRYTCEGEDVSPPLEIDAGDSGAKALALIVDDPDAPRGPFVHWVLYNIPPQTKELPEDASRALPQHARNGTNDFRRTGWSGPCPRAGVARHRYVFTLYALDEEITGASAFTKDALLSLMSHHIIAQAQLVGRYALTQRRTLHDATR